MKTSKIIFIFFLLIFALIFLLSTNIKASDDINTKDYKSKLTYSEASSFFEKAATVIKILRNIAAIVAVVAISIIGFQYMIGSVNERAQYKEKLMPVVIGAILVVSLGTILTVIANVMDPSTGSHGGGGGGPSTTMVELQ